MSETDSYIKVLRVAELNEMTIRDRLGQLLHHKDLEITTSHSEDAVDIKIISKAKKGQEAAQLIAQTEQAIRTILGDYIFGMQDSKLQIIIGNLLEQQNLTVATIESMTGGLIASALTDVHESSAHYLGGIVAYSTLLKERMGVPHETLEQHGVISEETAIAMAHAVRTKLEIEIGLGITGVAGPDKQEDQPVGTVYIAIDGPYGVMSGMGSEKCASPDREENKKAATISALNLLRRYLEQQRKR